ncbi:lipopolysaccharide transport system ATP-binding protein [Duganella sp. CF517]|uniref:ABC transporter ATP-binding protein n=1 Tax=Duganella sp. CF517 TaxID=1881038 RepID=UPI0008ABD40B|nr:ABC transporter ATP-binding protein [Duganella sp. CF517]SEO21112.1 lipopolysaccharide transport system ATP-binding protein [Duganella sp. CF517]
MNGSISHGSIEVTSLGKAYRRYPNHRARLLEWLSPSKRPRHDTIWVLKDVSFSVRPGQALGIIGINGAGKSTLLKLITGTAAPTVGRVAIGGRVAAMLELGMGFHPDFTGRQNAYMAGQLLGMSVAELTALMPAIEAFAEIGEYIDQPVRVYSSGMQMRLAFSVATARRPDVLIVDEALSVGDAYFQHKSFERIRAFRAEGTTLLIVSHDKGAIQSVCDRAILLDKGRVSKEGTPEEIMDLYNAMLAEREGAADGVRQETLDNGKVQTISGTGEATVRHIALLKDDGTPAEVHGTGTAVTLSVEVAVHADIAELTLGFRIKDRLGQNIFGTNTFHKLAPLRALKAGQRLRANWRFRLDLGPGSYSVATALHSDDNHLGQNYEWRDLALVFEVMNLQHSYFEGCAWLDPQIDIVHESAP